MRLGRSLNCHSHAKAPAKLSLVGHFVRVSQFSFCFVDGLHAVCEHDDVVNENHDEKQLNRHSRWAFGKLEVEAGLAWASLHLHGAHQV